MIKYRKSVGGIVFDLAENKFIPCSPDNTDYQTYLAWCAEGNTAALADPVVPSVPEEVTAWQAKTALLNAGLLLDVESAIIGMTGIDGAAARKDWFSAPTWRRSWPLVAAMQQAFGWPNNYVDQLFIAAAQL
jgi:hypothetical protein